MLVLSNTQQQTVDTNRGLSFSFVTQGGAFKMFTFSQLQSTWRLDYGLGDEGIAVRNSAEEKRSSFLQHVQTVCGAHTASYSMDSESFSLGVERRGIGTDR